jgi:hypothetical protein
VARAILRKIFSPCSLVAAVVDAVGVARRREKILYTALRPHWRICITERPCGWPFLGTNRARIVKVAVALLTVRRRAGTAMAEVLKYSFARLAPAWYSRCSPLAVLAEAPASR